MKKVLALLLISSLLLYGCASQNDGVKKTYSSNEKPSEITGVSSENQTVGQSTVLSFTDISDPNLLTYVEDTVYSDLVGKLDSESYFVENVSAIYQSKEYLEELAYNSKENIYFGFKLSDIEKQFEGSKFIFTLGDDGQTVIQKFEEYDDTYDQVIKNVTIGTGVILLCVTVSLVSGAVGAPAVCLVFAASAKTGTIVALSSGLFSGCAAGVVTGIETNDFSKAVKSAALAGSDGLKWGAITGTIIGGATTASALKGATLGGLKMNQAAAIQKESKYPLDVIKQFNTIEQYEICKNAGLTSKMINGKTALIRKIDLNYVDEFGRTNLVRMRQNLSPLDPKTGIPYELHHIGQKMDSTLAILTKSEHIQGGNNKIWHIFEQASEIDRPVFAKQKADFWKAMAEHLVTTGG
jgi:hypothetical protein